MDGLDPEWWWGGLDTDQDHHTAAWKQALTPTQDLESLQSALNKYLRKKPSTINVNDRDSPSTELKTASIFLLK